MAHSDVLRPPGEEYACFLYSYVGEDRKGIGVTVLSALARLGFDPWKEASELAKLSETAAHARLDSMISSFDDVPAMGEQHSAITRRLIALLPRRASLESGARGSSASGASAIVSAPPRYLIVFVLLMLAQILYFAWSNMGG